MAESSEERSGLMRGIVLGAGAVCALFSILLAVLSNWYSAARDLDSKKLSACEQTVHALKEDISALKAPAGGPIPPPTIDQPPPLAKSARTGTPSNVRAHTASPERGLVANQNTTGDGINVAIKSEHDVTVGNIGGVVRP